MNFEMETLLQTFLAESEDGLGRLEQRLLALEDSPQDAECLDEIFRVLHTLKGDAGSLGFPVLSAFAHHLEDTLEEIRKGHVLVTSGLVSALLEAVDVLRQQLWCAAEGAEEERPEHQRLLTRLSAESAWEGAATGRAAAAARARSASAVSTPTPAGSETLRVGIERLDALLDLTGELGVARGRLSQMLETSSVPRGEILELHREHDRLFASLQELVTKLRMVPVGSTFRRYLRVVRDLAFAEGKQARLVLEGEDAEIDARVIEQLRDPLTHMIRNAVDHGIERPEARVAAGKDQEGCIILRAHHDSGSIVIEVSDDGAGLDCRRILEKAKAVGLVAEGESPSEERIHRLIFEVGFTTAERVTDVSGRGVGMDVVRRNIDALRGSVAVASRAGRGTTFTIRLPLTLAIIDGFQVGVGGETYIIPLDAVTETLAFRGGETSGGGGRGLIGLRGKSIPFVHLRSLFDLAGALPRRQSIVLVRHGAGEVGLVVDELHGHEQTVIKPLAKLFRRLPGVSGSAILGDGRVALILDVPGLLRGETERPGGSSAVAPLESERGEVSWGAN